MAATSNLEDVPSVDLMTELLRRMKCASKPDKRLILVGTFPFSLMRRNSSYDPFVIRLFLSYYVGLGFWNCGPMLVRSNWTLDECLCRVTNFQNLDW